jgi:hypothetical protein
MYIYQSVQYMNFFYTVDMIIGRSRNDFGLLALFYLLHWINVILKGIVMRFNVFTIDISISPRCYNKSRGTTFF